MGGCSVCDLVEKCAHAFGGDIFLRFKTWAGKADIGGIDSCNPNTFPAGVAVPRFLIAQLVKP